MSEERKMLRRLVTRLKSARASVMLEFAFVAPLVAVTAIFAADFTRILRTEQQLEIATRLAADVESHMADYYGSGASPSSAAKNVGKEYLVRRRLRVHEGQLQADKQPHYVRVRADIRLLQRQGFL